MFLLTQPSFAEVDEVLNRTRCKRVQNRLLSMRTRKPLTLISHEGRIVSANRYVEETMGLNSMDMRGASVLNLLDHVSHEMADEMVSQNLPTPYVAWAVPSNGDRVLVGIQGTPIEWDGKIMRLAVCEAIERIPQRIVEKEGLPTVHQVFQ